MTHLSVPDIPSANSAPPNSTPYPDRQMSLHVVQFPQPRTGRQRHLYGGQNIRQPTPGIWEPTNKALTLISAGVKTVVSRLRPE